MNAILNPVVPPPIPRVVLTPERDATCVAA